MADLALTAAQISAVYPQFAEVYSFIAAETITAGQVVAFDTSADDDKLYVADGDDGDIDQPVGVALEGGGAGQAIPVLVRGFVEGYTVSAIANYTLLYLSDTAGAIATTGAESTANAAMGRIMPNSQSTPRLLVFVDCSFNTQWS